MSKDFKTVNIQKLKSINEIDVDIVKTLEQRKQGLYNKRNLHPCDLQVHAEDVFVKKKFDELQCEMPGTPRSTFLMVFSPDGSKVASTHGNHNIYVTDVRSGKNLKTLIGHPRTPWCIAFHPTSNQILASGCLGGQVRIWDLSGGSEVWTSEIPTVIASIAFHPDDRLLAIATYNELYFWDWSKPAPFMHVATNNLKEKVRYVAFDKLGHKLITGISNSPQTRWERVRAPVSVPRQTDRSASPYRRRITPRLISNMPVTTAQTQSPQNNNSNSREPLSTVPERERRITACYRNLVREYELLVHRYLQIYRPPTMVDQGTDPMEIDLNNITNSNRSSRSSTSGTQINNLQIITSRTESNSLPSVSNYIHSIQPPDAIEPQPTVNPSPSRRMLNSSSPRRVSHNVNSERILGHSSTNISNNYNINTADQVTPIDLSTSPSAQSSNVINDRQMVGAETDSQGFLMSTSYESIPSLENDILVLAPSEICSLRRSAKNIHSTQTQQNDYNIENAPSTSGQQKQNEQKNSRSTRNTSNMTHELHTTQSNINAPLIHDSVSRCPPNDRASDQQSNVSPSHSGNQPTITTTSNSSARESYKNIGFMQTSSGVQTASSSSNVQSCSSNTTEPKHSNRMKVKASVSNNTNNKNNEKSLTDIMATNYFDILNEIKNISSNINQVPHPPQQTIAQTTEQFLGSLETKESSSRRSDVKKQADTPPALKFVENLKSEFNNNATNISDNEPRPSTSGICTRSSENYDSSSSRDDPRVYLPKKDSYKFYEHSRKRLYPGFTKKNRKPIIDSSSDSSSSEEDSLITKRVCSTKASTLSASAVANASTPNTTPQQNSCNYNNRNLVKPKNFNKELELLVTDLLTDNENFTTSQHTVYNKQDCSGATHAANKICNACQNSVEQSSGSTISGQNVAGTSTSTNSNTCPRSTANTNTRTNTAVYTSAANIRGNRPGRFYSHRVSAFYPTRIQNLRSYSRLRRNSSYLSSAMRTRLRTLNTLHSSSRLPGTFALDEVINYSERVPTDEDAPEPSLGFHPFDPPPEFATINPENIGIGNMYSNIVQELESSLNDVRNIRPSNRLGETSDMLSSFSERLESIMNQSNAILRNLRTSLDTLQPNDQNENNSEPQQQSSLRNSEPRVLFSDSSFYLREQRSNQTSQTNFDTQDTSNILESFNSQDDIFSSHNVVISDHTYPLNSRNSRPTTNNMTPLMASLHLTVSHIQRQARLLRQQVESIERIDRAMLEVAQLQMMRQMFIELQCYFRTSVGIESRSAVSSVRQMMAGTRISDSSPYDSPNDESTNENATIPIETDSNRSNAVTNIPQNITQTRNESRKTYPRCIFLMHRHFRKGLMGNILQRRCLSRERMMRRHLFRRSAFTCRSVISRPPVDFTANRNRGNFTQTSSENLRTLTRRLENFLMEHGRQIGRLVESNRANSLNTEKDEYIMMLRLNQCRARILSQNAQSTSNIRRQTSSVTLDGSSRYNARDMLTLATESLSRYLINGTVISPSLRTLIWNVIDLSLLLSEILLLQIVDSIPPPSGMNLDPERESLSARIDQMCSRMLQSRLSGNSQQLTRSLRLTRLAVRHASRALDQTYAERRNSMLPTSHNRDQRRELLEEINNCLRNIRRHGTVTQIFNQRVDGNTENLSRTEWYRTIHSLITRYRCSTFLETAQPTTSGTRTTDNDEQLDRIQTAGPSINYTQASSDDDNDSYWYNNNNNSTTTNNNNNNNISNNDSTNLRNDHLRPLYRTNNVNLFSLLNSEDSNSSTSATRSRPWNVPTVQVNDVPISQYQSPWHPRFLANRQRINERFSELRTYPVGGIFRPRFLHPFYSGNPFEVDFDESVREQIYDSDIMTPVTPNHRIQVWEFSSGVIPNINNALKNVVVNECKIHNDASVDIANNGNILVTLLPSGGYLNGTNRLGIYSLEWETLGQCLYITNFEQNAVSVSLSPLSRHLVVGLASRRVSIMPNEKWTMARIFVLDEKQSSCNQLLPVREVEQTRDPNYMSVNCIRWLPVSGQGLVFATNTGQLRILT